MKKLMFVFAIAVLMAGITLCGYLVDVTKI